LESSQGSRYRNEIRPRGLNDAGDFSNMVVTNPEMIDLRKLRSLAAKVYRGGGKRILALVDDIKAERPIWV